MVCIFRRFGGSTLGTRTFETAAGGDAARRRCRIILARSYPLGTARTLSRLHQLAPIFAIFLGVRARQVIDCIGPSARESSVVPTKALARRSGRRESRACFCAIRFAARTARSIGPGRWSRIAGFATDPWFNPSRRRKSRPRSTPKRLELLAPCSADLSTRPPAIPVLSGRSVPPVGEVGLSFLTLAAKASSTPRAPNRSLADPAVLDKPDHVYTRLRRRANEREQLH